jgi:hypothetical protein
MKNIPLMLLVLCALSACATLHPQAISETGPGFFTGIWHGLVAPPAFLVRIFADTVAIYETPNTGGWYDFGFLLGLSAWGGGSAAATRG